MCTAIPKELTPAVSGILETTSLVEAGTEPWNEICCRPKSENGGLLSYLVPNFFVRLKIKTHTHDFFLPTLDFNCP